MTESRSEDRIFHRARKEKWPLISHGEGVYLVDTEGRRYLDACAGVHVVSIGHGVEEIAEAMREQAGKVSPEQLLHKVLDMMSCKAAVKAGDKLSGPEIRNLLKQRNTVERSSNCPHGRPTTIHMSLNQLEKQFKRT